MNNIIVTTSLFFSLSLLACSVKSKSYWNIEKEKVQKCRDEWSYKDLEKEIVIRVLLYNSKKNLDISSFPNFVIGVTNSMDTIAIMDKDFEGTINRGSSITVSPLLWTDIEKEIMKPMFTVYPKSKENDLYCSVKIIYYGNINE